MKLSAACRSALRKLLIANLAFVFLTASFSHAAQQGEMATGAARTTPQLQRIEKPPEKTEIFTDSYYEYSNVIQGSRKGGWKEFTNLAGIAKGRARGYFSVSQLSRFTDENYTANFGAYYTMDDSYYHFETGFGWDISYIYRLQNIAEYAHRIYKGLYWQLGYNFRAYKPGGDTHRVYPGLIYYFGDSYVSFDYSAAMIESRGSTGNMGALRWNIALCDRIDWWGGGAYGQWLYDIYGLPANDEFGYIAYSGLTFDITKWASLRIGYSLGAEEPKFFKRNIMWGLAFKF